MTSSSMPSLKVTKRPSAPRSSRAGGAPCGWPARAPGRSIARARSRLESRHGRREREIVRVRRVDAGDQRLRDALERLAAEPAPHEGARALVVVQPRGRTRSRAMRSLPRQEKSPDATNGPSLVGAELKPVQQR